MPICIHVWNGSLMFAPYFATHFYPRAQYTRSRSRESVAEAEPIFGQS